MDLRTKELIAIGAAIGAHCQPCLTYHVHKAKELEIDEESIKEAIAIGQAVEKASMVTMRKFAGSILDPESPLAICNNIAPSSCCG